jgi:hypothetical protein
MFAYQVHALVMVVGLCVVLTGRIYRRPRAAVG